MSSTEQLTPAQLEVIESRKKLAEKMGSQRNGTNTARRKHKNVSKTTVFLILRDTD